MKIVVIGGTGLIGSKLVKKLREHGHEAVAASPDSGVNTLTGEGLAEALEGASVVVDVSNSPSFEDTAVMKFFETSTRNLLQQRLPPAWATTSRCRSWEPSDCPNSGGCRAHHPRILPREAGPGKADQGVLDPLLDRPRHAVLRVRQEHRRRRHRRRRRSAWHRCSSSPMAADDVAAAVGRSPWARH